MRYEQVYQQAMKKLSASDSWKAETLKKMAQQPRRTTSLFVVKRAVLPVAAAVAVISAVLLFPQTDSVSTETAGNTEQNLQTADLPLPAQQDAAAQPRTAMLFSEDAELPTLAFSAAQLTEVSVQQLPDTVDLSGQPYALPVWQQQHGGFCLLGEYPLLSAQEAAMDANIGDFVSAELIYVQSMEFLQPCYRFILHTQESPVYVTAICGEYY